MTIFKKCNEFLKPLGRNSNSSLKKRNNRNNANKKCTKFKYLNVPIIKCKNRYTVNSVDDHLV